MWQKLLLSVKLLNIQGYKYYKDVAHRFCLEGDYPETLFTRDDSWREYIYNIVRKYFVCKTLSLRILQQK